MRRTGRPRGKRSCTDSYRPPASIPGSDGLVRLNQAVHGEAHHKLWLAAQAMNTSMSVALELILMGLPVDDRGLPEGMPEPASPNQLQLSA
jgi:hypothetical protein